MAKSWDTGLLCRLCGKRVKRGQSGVYHFELAGRPWAEHIACREKAGK